MFTIYQWSQWIYEIPYYSNKNRSLLQTMRNIEGMHRIDTVGGNYSICSWSKWQSSVHPRLFETNYTKLSRPPRDRDYHYPFTLNWSIQMTSRSSRRELVTTSGEILSQRIKNVTEIYLWRWGCVWDRGPWTAPIASRKELNFHEADWHPLQRLSLPVWLLASPVHLKLYFWAHSPLKVVKITCIVIVTLSGVLLTNYLNKNLQLR